MKSAFVEDDKDEGSIPKTAVMYIRQKGMES